MNGFPTREEVKRLRERYPEGARIVLDRMGDDPFPIPDGSMGTVRHVDDIGTVHVDFDCGRRLGLIPGEDRFHLSETPDRNKILRGVDLNRDAFFFDPVTRFVTEVFFEKSGTDAGQFVCGCLPFSEILEAAKKASGDPTAFFRMLDEAAYRECVGLDADSKSLREAVEAMHEPADYLGRNEATMVCLIRDAENALIQKKHRTIDDPVR